MKKNIVVLVTVLFITLLTTAGSASMMWRNSGSGKLTATLTFTDQISGKKTIRNYVNYSGFSSNYAEVHRDPANHFLFKVHTENVDASGMLVDVSAVGSGISRSAGAIEAVSAWVNTMPDCAIRLADGVSMETIKAIKITSALSIGLADQCSGPIYLTAAGTVNYYGSRFPGCVTMAVPFKNVQPSLSPYDSISRGTTVAANQAPEILNGSIPVIMVPFCGSASVDLSNYINDENVGTVKIYTLSPNLNGTASGLGTLTLDYTATDSFLGTDFCSFTVQDENLAESNAGMINFYVDPATVPIALDMFITSSVNSPTFEIPIDSNLIVQYDAGLIVEVMQPTLFNKGSVAVDKVNNKIVYTPIPPGPAVFDCIKYKVSKGGMWYDTGTIVINPTP